MSSHPAVTVFMAVYNGAAWLKEAIDSILTQSFADLELLIIDDGSTDGSRAIIERCGDRRIRLLLNEQNKGIVYTRNRGIREARGKFIAILDSDDIAMPGRIERQYKHLRAHPDLAICGGHAEVIDQHGKPTGEYYRMPVDMAEAGAELLFRNTLVNSTVMFRKDAAEAAGGYRDTGLCEDYDLALRLKERHQLDNLDEVLVKYRAHGSSTSSRQFREMRKSEERILRDLHQRMGIPCDEQLIKVHLSFIHPSPGLFPIMDYFRLFKELKTANDRLGFFPEKTLNRLLFTKWYELIRQTNAPKALTLFFKKPLFHPAYATFKRIRKIVRQAFKRRRPHNDHK
ncbi:cellulose synthase/poly-beta-1,6-N-acetylglucosamine synthase-like glycosyltransferase [Anseongella ginsenosidimutans]|uniref:Cellulose synthase/poly-beta-1,6-N-acetylglucosamine synthase-like glycosyltransferase n=1 Tax=Anseongella ginsenosidimutans TaxID=496056 RepID=A0A4V2UTF1_9SPHI|nr:glycosyltransferase [Anseongella ginsenosidimutans]QEC51987.1 glycosyltransferase [Anseongella ginsenosidimutans]TCS85716.1 cellulose synthase/poly-beta-1,6-N-acetylglucosamine synthase-like glycosyltransferase [Anseongella ginsenosidimutans]